MRAKFYLLFALLALNVAVAKYVDGFQVKKFKGSLDNIAALEPSDEIPLPLYENIIEVSLGDKHTVPPFRYEFVRSISGMIRPQGLEFGPDGLLYAADSASGQINVIDVEWEVTLRSWGSHGKGLGQFDKIIGLTVGPNNRVYTCDWTNHRIQVFEKDGKFVSAWGSQGTEPGQFNVPVDAVIGKNGLLYVVDKINARIQAFTLEGQFMHMWGTEGNATGQFLHPSSIDVGSDGRLWVVEWMNHRLQV
jgi:hypothetical protein